MAADHAQSALREFERPRHRKAAALDRAHRDVAALGMIDGIEAQRRLVPGERIDPGDDAIGRELQVGDAAEILDDDLRVLFEVVELAAVALDLEGEEARREQRGGQSPFDHERLVDNDPFEQQALLGFDYCAVFVNAADADGEQGQEYGDTDNETKRSGHRFSGPNFGMV